MFHWTFITFSEDNIVMISLNELLPDENTFEMYHGGQRWSGRPELQLPSHNRYEAGIGIYFTTSYAKAREYARGGKVVTIAKIKKQFTEISKVRVPLNELLQFVKTCDRLRNKSEIIQDITGYSVRTKTDNIPLDILMNLVINYESGSGKVGLEIARYLRSKGVDAIVQHQSMDDWLVVINPEIIVSHHVVDPKKLDMTKYNLPRIQ